MSLNDSTPLFIWNGSLTVRCEGRSREQLHRALSLFVRASAADLLNPSASVAFGISQTDAQFSIDTQNLPSILWVILVNILYFDGKSPGTLYIQGNNTEVSIQLEPTPFAYPLPEPLMACDLSSLLDHMDNFSLRFEFGDSLSAQRRDAICDALDAWVALVDASGFPMTASITYGSAIAAPDVRFEDAANACLGAEGIAADPNCFGLLINLANRLHIDASLNKLVLECTG